MPRSESNERSPSTATVWEWAKIRRRPKGPPHRSAKLLSALEPRDPLTITVRYLGGSEAWLEIKARGEVFKCPGHRAALDLMTQLWNRQP